MQVTEIVNDGLSRELEVTIPVTTLNDKLDTYLKDMKSKVRINGFRPGKVPVSHLKRVYGKQAMAEIVNDTLSETIRSTLEEREEKPAMQPDVDLDDAVAQKSMSGEQDLTFKLNYEILPSFEVGDFSAIQLERPVAEVSEAETTERIEKMAESARPFEPREEGEAAAAGDQVTIDFVGKVDGEPFEGGTGEDVNLVIGSGRFIPGFEDQLIGAKVGEEPIVKVAFPEDYNAAELAGKDAEFATKIKSVAAPGELSIDDEFAKTLGVESLEKLTEIISGQIQDQYSQASRQKVKRKLLDHLDETYSFELPKKLLTSEFEVIWKQVLEDMKRNDRSFDDEDADEEKSRADYMRIAERRVRLGLLLSEVGERNGVQVSDEETKNALLQQARQFPGQESQVFEYYKSNPQALAALRGPLYEDKVIDFVLELAEITDVPVPKEELLAPDEDETDF